jgi:hypothetical protein
MRAAAPRPAGVQSAKRPAAAYRISGVPRRILISVPVGCWRSARLSAPVRKTQARSRRRRDAAGDFQGIGADAANRA